MKFSSFLLVLTFLTLSVSAQNKKPNIIFVLADDLGIDGISSYGADLFKTPEIDKLAKNGIRYTNAYTAPLCGPSRAMILTGRYAFRTGAVNQDQTGEFKPSDETMMSKILKSADWKFVFSPHWLPGLMTTSLFSQCFSVSSKTSATVPDPSDPKTIGNFSPAYLPLLIQ